MGLGNLIGSLFHNESDAAEQGTSQHSTILGALMSEVESRPGGIGGLMQAFQQRGMGSSVQQWSSGNTQAANPSDMESGFAGSGITEGIAQRTGLPASAISSVLAMAMPFVIHHVVSNGHVTAEGESTGKEVNSGDLLRSVMERMTGSSGPGSGQVRSDEDRSDQDRAA
jgi:uncharacterized protein YidB (DUF937 family)